MAVKFSVAWCNILIYLQQYALSNLNVREVVCFIPREAKQKQENPKLHVDVCKWREDLLQHSSESRVYLRSESISWFFMITLLVLQKSNNSAFLFILCCFFRISNDKKIKGFRNMAHI